MTLGNNTNNYSEQAIRITKDTIFDRLKAYNAVQMFHFVTKTMEMYYKRRLLALPSNRLDHFVALHFGLQFQEEKQIQCLYTQSTPQNQLMYSKLIVEQTTLTWIVYLSAGTYTCLRGRQGSRVHICCQRHYNTDGTV